MLNVNSCEESTPLNIALEHGVRLHNGYKGSGGVATVSAVRSFDTTPPSSGEFGGGLPLAGECLGGLEVSQILVVKNYSLQG